MPGEMLRKKRKRFSRSSLIVCPNENESSIFKNTMDPVLTYSDDPADTLAGSTTSTSAAGGDPVADVLPPEDTENKECMPDSSMIQELGYSPMLKTLFVVFNTRAVYKFENVPEEVFGRLCNAESTGRYFNFNVRDRYSFRRIQ